MTHRISLPKHMVRAGGEDKEDCAALKTCLSSDRLEVDFDASSDISSELSFGYEFAQAEVTIKGMGSNGEPSWGKKEICFGEEDRNGHRKTMNEKMKSWFSERPEISASGSVSTDFAFLCFLIFFPVCQSA